MEDHIYNLLKVANKVKHTKKPNLYHHLNLAFKGVVGQLDEATLKEVIKALDAEHKKTISFVKDLIKKDKASQKPASQKAA